MTKPRPALSHAAITAQALVLIDKHGIAEFSTRKLGRALGVEAMALYYYYASKDAILDAVVDKLIADISSDLDDARDFVSAMRDLAGAYRRVAHEHPGAFPLLATRRFASETTYAFLEHLFGLARTHGIDDRTAARFYRTISSYCNGFGLNEMAAPRGAALRSKYARVTAVATYFEPAHHDDTFEFGLELILEALRRAIKK